MQCWFPRWLLILISFGLLLIACGQATLQPTTGLTSTPDGAGANETDLFAGVPQGQTTQGYHTLGADSAAVKLVMYSDFL
ncbi:MAG: hypothetical protein H0X37_15460 [Herpetosiphonaceae bacterium]|nr:hypothetical protein [Herpetosiphonaceae bacterium]